MLVVYGIKINFLQLLGLLANETLNDTQAAGYIKAKFLESNGNLLVKIECLSDVLRYYKITSWLADDGMSRLLNVKHPHYEKLQTIWKQKTWQAGLSSNFRFVNEMTNVVVGSRLAGDGSICVDLEVVRKEKEEEFNNMCSMLKLSGHTSYYCM